MTTELEARILALLRVVGNPALCRGCGAEIFWIKTRAGKAAPYTPAGVNHFSDCPQANRFRGGSGDGRRD